MFQLIRSEVKFYFSSPPFKLAVEVRIATSVNQVHLLAKSLKIWVR
jgi:hypothetical protein